MALFSRRVLTESAAREQITALSEFDDGLIRPDKCSEFEPIRAPFDPADIREPVRWLAKPNGEFLYKKGKPVYASGEIWNLIRSRDARFPAGPFTNYWTGRFDGEWAGRVGIEKVRDFVCEMFRATASDFGFLADVTELKAKNTVATSYSYMGMRMESGVPGLYWVNLFSDQFARWLELETFPKELAVVETLVGGGVSLMFGASPDQCKSVKVLQRQRAAIDWLGPEKFFDIHAPNRKAETPDWINIPLPL